MLECERLEAGGIAVLRLHGEVDGEGEGNLRRAINALVRDGHRTVVLNLAGVRLISYRGVGVMVEMLSLLRSMKGDLKLSGMNLQGSRLMDKIGVAHVFERYDLEQAAIFGCKPEAA